MSEKAETLEWIRQWKNHPEFDQYQHRRLLANAELIDALRESWRNLQDYILALPEIQARKLTVEDAQRLDVCRICRGPAKATWPDNHFCLNYGKEYAHRRCLDKEAVGP